MPDLTCLSVLPAPANLSLSLASDLFAEAAALARLPSDGAYADLLLILAFNHLSAGLGGAIDGAALIQCAQSIEACTYLSEAVRRHVAATLRGAAGGTTPTPLALNIISAAAARHSYQLLLYAAGSIASEGLGNLADTLADAIDGLAEAVTATKH